ncbi:ankyrin repeat domain-containing protein [Maribellus sp. YY47]|uniref:ankyrin repeat domain-containing protein n=1 Tax=Maribellus sp. YY47 TaxID=2929486 RepID=UPI002001C17E|nr:ankyrin repeat domain-containing protein [Maribellus sp. YY47]MCK3682482.1 ankyrin repeat domain-containing protein [Maribellus sp. YY47]
MNFVFGDSAKSENYMACKNVFHRIFPLLLLFLLAGPFGGFSQDTKPPGDSIKLSILLAEAILKSDTLKVDSLLSAGVDVNIAASEGVTPLMYAAQDGNLYFIRKLLQAGARVNQVPDNKVTALQSAVISGKKEAAELLIENGADLNSRDQWRNTPVLSAAENNNIAMVEMLIGEGADINVANNDGNTALHYAAVFGNDSLVGLLMDAGADANMKDYEGFTPLMVATSENFISTAELLLSYATDLNVVNNQGYSAFTIAILNGNVYLAELFLLNGADGNLLSREARDHWYFSKGTGKYMRKVLRESDVKRNLSPVLEDFAAGLKLGWIDRYFTTALLLGVRETKYNLWVQLSFGLNPFVYSTLRELNRKKYQFWERDYRLALEADKYLPFHKSYQAEFGIYAGAEAGYDFGTYRGTRLHPSSDLNILPSAGLFWRQGFTETRIGYKRDVFHSGESGVLGIQVHFYFGRM